METRTPVIVPSALLKKPSHALTPLERRIATCVVYLHRLNPVLAMLPPRCHEHLGPHLLAVHKASHDGHKARRAGDELGQYRAASRLEATVDALEKAVAEEVRAL